MKKSKIRYDDRGKKHVVKQYSISELLHLAADTWGTEAGKMMDEAQRHAGQRMFLCLLFILCKVGEL